MTKPLPITPELLDMASRGQPLCIEGDSLMWVMMLMRAGYIRATVIPDEGPTHLKCKLTPKGRELLNWFRR